MTVTRVRIAAVSYLNTIPFIYGIEHAGRLQADLLLSPPAGCAEAFAKGEADIALIPVGALPSLSSDSKIITNYCLGAQRGVRSVVLASNTPLSEVRNIYLDSHSRTSALLVRYLAVKKWDIAPNWCELTDYSIVDSPAEGDAFLLIGDKVFPREGKFRYWYDLSDEWCELTRLPFVFAVWVAREGVDLEVLDALEESLTWGLEHTWEAVVNYGYDHLPYAYDYLTVNMDYLFDAQKRKALGKFWNDGLKATLRINPG
jgi:chorismate dehydratase